MNGLIGKIALVTGGGQGLGAAICRMLGEAGAIAVVADIREVSAENVAMEIQADGGKAMALRLDVCDDYQAEIAIQQVMQQYGRVDILINNAGTDVTLPVDELAIADWDKVLAVNLRAPFILSKLVLPVMKQRRQGHIVNIASTASKRAWANASAYHASKWGLLGFSHALHVEAVPTKSRSRLLLLEGCKPHLFSIAFLIRL